MEKKSNKTITRKPEKLFFEIAEELSSKNKASLSQMFGKPCLKNDEKKAFAAFFKDSIVIKLQDEKEVNKLLTKKGIQLWDPSGKKRPMKQWVQIPYAYSEQWKHFLEQALNKVKPDPRTDIKNQKKGEKPV